MEKFLELAKERYSCREFEEREVEQEKIDSILKAAQLAPTACNNQPQRIYVLQSEESKAKMRSLIKYHFNAPLLMLICFDESVSWKNQRDGTEIGPVDATIVTTQMMLEATELGLGTTFVGAFDKNLIAKEFELPDHIKPVAILPIGYPKAGSKPSQMHEEREEIEKITKYL